MGIWAALIGFYLGCLYLGYSGYFYRFYKVNTVFCINWYLFFVVQLLMTGAAFYLVDNSILIKILVTTVFLVVLGILFNSKVRGYAFKAN